MGQCQTQTHPIWGQEEGGKRAVGASGSISPLPGGTEALEHSCISQKATTTGFKMHI